MNTSYFDRLLSAREKYGDITVAEDGKCSMNYSRLLSGAEAFAVKLSEMGIEQGDHVALCAYNSCAWLCAFLGIVKAGAVAVLMNYSLSVGELLPLYRDTDCKAFLYGRCSASVKTPALLSTLEADRLLDIDSFGFETLYDFTPQGISPEDYGKAAFIVFTSGSTGSPKGGLLTQRSNINGADAFLKIIPAMEGESLCLAVPMFHMFGLSVTTAHLLGGGKLLLPEKFTAAALLEQLEAHRPDALAAVMTVVTRLTDSPAFPLNGFDCVKRIYTGGAPLMPMQLIRTEYAFRSAKLLNCYGQTETDSGICFTVESDSFEKRSTTVGKPLPHRHVVILGADGEPCPTGAVGEVALVSSGDNSLGYYKIPAEEQPFDARGYLHTGDLGYLDEEGYLHLSGRIKDIIIKGGENIIPSEIEAEISRIEGVREVKVMGAPNSVYGESIEACVTTDPEAALDESRLKEALKGTLSVFRTPAHFFFLDSFPVKANGKTDLCALKIQMLRLFNLRLIDEDIDSGISVLYISANSQRYIIEPVCLAISDIVKKLGFGKKKADRIVHCFEEIMLERSFDAYMQSGTMSFELLLLRDRLRVRFSDERAEPLFGDPSERSRQSLGIKIILAMTDSISVDTREDRKTVYDLDYYYDTDFDPKAYLSFGR